MICPADFDNIDYSTESESLGTNVHRAQDGDPRPRCRRSLVDALVNDPSTRRVNILGPEAQHVDERGATSAVDEVREG